MISYNILTSLLFPIISFGAKPVAANRMCRNAANDSCTLDYHKKLTAFDGIAGKHLFTCQVHSSNQNRGFDVQLYKQ